MVGDRLYFDDRFNILNKFVIIFGVDEEIDFIIGGRYAFVAVSVCLYTLNRSKISYISFVMIVGRTRKPAQLKLLDSE